MSSFDEKTSGGVAVLSPTEIGSKRKKKFTGGNASKRHRDRVNIEFNNLAKLLPFPESVIIKLDKSSILRLAVSYIRAKSFFKDTKHVFEHGGNSATRPPEEKNVQDFQSKSIQEGTGVVSEMFSHALDGFLLVLTEDMKVLFVSESVRDYLGYCQAGIIHENFLQFVNPSDHGVVQSSIMYRNSEVDTRNETAHEKVSYTNNSSSYSPAARDFENRGPNHGVARRHFICRMKCAFSCSSRFYTAYRTFQFTGHLRRSTIQEGREQKHLNTLVVFATPATSGTNSSIDFIPDMEDRPGATFNSRTTVEHSDFSYERFSSGFRIEPTLRPHIAPIPVSNSETTERRSPQTTHVVKRQAPPLIHADALGRESFYMSNTYSPFISKLYPGPSSNESRYSDLSDDSKCSPASSPNLIWKHRTSSPQMIKRRTDLIDVSDEHIYRRKKMLEAEYHLQRSTPKYEREKIYSSRRESFDEYINPVHARRRSPSALNMYVRDTPSRGSAPNVDVFVGASMLMNLRKHDINPHYSYRTEHSERDYSRKRILEEPTEYRSRSPKRIKSPGRSGFDITSLLGLEDKVSHRDRHGMWKEENIEAYNAENGQREARILYKDIFYKMSKNLDNTFIHTMSPAGKNW